jgi:hypothetical protein
MNKITSFNKIGSLKANPSHYFALYRGLIELKSGDLGKYFSTMLV